MAAEYVENEVVRLVFDRAIDITGLDGSQIIVDDGALVGSKYTGTGTSALINAVTVHVGLVEVEPWPGSDVRLTATAFTGNVAVDDGGTWDGVTNLVLPFP